VERSSGNARPQTDSVENTSAVSLQRDPRGGNRRVARRDALTGATDAKQLHSPAAQTLALFVRIEVDHFADAQIRVGERLHDLALAVRALLVRLSDLDAAARSRHRP